MTSTDTLNDQDRTIINSATIRDALRKRFPGSLRVPKVIRDTEYLAYSREEIMAAVQQSEEVGSEYVEHLHDCDDMADGCAVDVKRICRGAPFGILMYAYWQNGRGAAHVVCFFYDHKSRRIVLVEPADGSIHTLPPNAHLIEMRL